MLNAADFGDLLLECIRLFREQPDVLRQYQARFRYILVDEYQDTNVAQYLWLRLLGQSGCVPACARQSSRGGPRRGSPLPLRERVPSERSERAGRGVSQATSHEEAPSPAARCARHPLPQGERGRPAHGLPGRSSRRNDEPRR